MTVHRTSQGWPPAGLVGETGSLLVRVSDSESTWYTVVPLLKDTLAKRHRIIHVNTDTITRHQVIHVIGMPLILPLKGHGDLSKDRIIWRKGCPYTGELL